MKASKKNNQATEVKVEVAPQPLTERQSLRALCKELRAKYGTDERINNLLCIYYKPHPLSCMGQARQPSKQGNR